MNHPFVSQRWVPSEQNLPLVQIVTAHLPPWQVDPAHQAQERQWCRKKLAEPHKRPHLSSSPALPTPPHAFSAKQSYPHPQYSLRLQKAGFLGKLEKKKTQHTTILFFFFFYCGVLNKTGVGNSNPLQYSCLENSMDRGAWQATVRVVTKSWTRLSSHTTS